MHFSNRESQEFFYGSERMSRSCCVLDLDSTLVNTFGTEKDRHFVEGETRDVPKSRFFDLSFDGLYMWGSKRPYCDKFLKSCFDIFDVVGIWSAGIEPYVNEISYEIFSNRGFVPDFVWSKEDCVQTFHEESNRPVRQKPLSKIYSEIGNIDPKRTIIFDDNISVCDQDSLNHFVVPPWNGNLETMHVPDNCLLLISEWIEQKVSKAKDYTKLSHKGILDGPKVVWTPCQLK